MLITKVRYPRCASFVPVAAARLVLPTPPLPLNRRILMLKLYPHFLAAVVPLACYLPAQRAATQAITRTILHRANLSRIADVIYRQLRATAPERSVGFRHAKNAFTNLHGWQFKFTM